MFTKQIFAAANKATKSTVATTTIARFASATLVTAPVPIPKRSQTRHFSSTNPTRFRNDQSSAPATPFPNINERANATAGKRNTAAKAKLQAGTPHATDLLEPFIKLRADMDAILEELDARLKKVRLERVSPDLLDKLTLELDFRPAEILRNGDEPKITSDGTARDETWARNEEDAKQNNAERNESENNRVSNSETQNSYSVRLAQVAANVKIVNSLTLIVDFWDERISDAVVANIRGKNCDGMILYAKKKSPLSVRISKMPLDDRKKDILYAQVAEINNELKPGIDDHVAKAIESVKKLRKSPAETTFLDRQVKQRRSQFISEFNTLTNKKLSDINSI
ncbi:hypothetical protein HK100_004550 [Physocladia obscura]|uniref:Ribosome recycling factor domain-containing protein n=1 Tax=Physocladia obscura TaxID=109957 RepID=A0AAD5SV93_9FUNG|nr:hypothetical protein HK100_004550 [Physocladia obscura]